MDEVARWLEVTRALQQLGFERVWEETARATFDGVLDPSGLSARARLELANLDFLESPAIYLRDLKKLGRALPHVLGPSGKLCYLDIQASVLDRYDPGGTVLTCIAIAEQVLRDAVKGRADRDFIEEFAAYWDGNSYAYVDLSADATSAEIAWVALRPEPGARTAILTSKRHLSPTFLARHQELVGGGLPERQACPIVDVHRALTVDPTRTWPPTTLKDLCDWLDSVSPGTVSMLERVFHVAEGLTRYVALRASNGVYLIGIEIPPRFRTDEFLKVRRKRLFGLLRGSSINVSVERVSTKRIDAEYVFSRNLPSAPHLMGKKIALVGCGSIGGFLGLQLAQSGAGAGTGCLKLYDPDSLQPNNLGRHVLGLRSLGANKAEGLKNLLLAETPHIHVESVPASVLHSLSSLRGYDLIVDATGEEALSISLNHRLIEQGDQYPPALYVWLLGNGSAAQALLVDGENSACYKCLKPNLSEPPRYRVLRDAASTELRRTYACGDALFTPYPVSRACAAASLALDLALDWAAGTPSPRLRFRVFEPRRTYAVKDCDPSPSAKCPACQHRH